MGLIFNGNNGTDTISATDGSLVIDGLDLGGVGNINAGIGTFSGNLNVGGVLTYEDVKNVDSVGIVTARTGVRITGGGLNVVGVSTISNSELRITSGAAHNTHLNYGNVGTNYITSANGNGTYFRGSSNNITSMVVLGSGQVDIESKLRHIGNTNTLMQFGTNTIQFDAGGTNYLKLHEYSSVKFVEVGATSALSFAENGANTRYMLIGDGSHTSTGAITMQAGAGSQGHGGGVTLYSHANSTNAGGVYIGKSLNSSGSIIFGNGGLSPSSEYVRITSGGFLGIGAGANTNKPLHIYTGSSDAEIRLQTNSGTEQNSYISLRQATGDLDLYTVVAGTKMKFFTANSERIRITGTGQFHMGGGSSWTYASQKFVVVEPNNALGMLLQGNNANQGVNLTLQNINNTVNAYSDLSFADDGGQIFGAIRGKVVDRDNNHGEIQIHTSAGSLGQRVTINKDGKVGIGNRTTNPSELLHVHTGSGAAVQEIEGATDATLILRSHSGDSSIKFADASSSNIGRIDYDHGSDSLAFRVNGEERLRINSDGKVLVGDGSAITQGRAFEVRGTGNQGILVGSTNNNGAQLLLDGIGGGDGSGGNYGALEVPTSGHLTIRNHDADKDIIIGTGSASGANDTVIITDTQMVGIGVDPGAVIHAYHATSNTIAQFESGDAGAAAIWKDNSTYSSIEQNATDFILHADPGASHAGSALSFKIDGNERLRISNAGFVTINSSSYEALKITTTENGNNGPEVQLIHNSASPAAADCIGQLRFSGKDSAGNTDLMGRIETIIDDPTSGQETAHLNFATRGYAAFNTILRLKARGTASAPSYTTDDMNGIILDTYNTGNPYPRYFNFIAKSAGNTDSNIGFWTEAVGNSPQERLRITKSGQIQVAGDGHTFGSSITVNRTMLADSAGNPIISGTPWYTTGTYSYDTNDSPVMDYYWIKIVETLGYNAIGYIEYMAHGDSNYPRSVHGFLEVAKYANGSVSVVHSHQNQSAGTVQCVVDSNQDVWLRFHGFDWNSDMRYRLVYGESITLNTDFTVNGTSGGRIRNSAGTPPNMSYDIVPGAAFRWNLSNTNPPKAQYGNTESQTAGTYGQNDSYAHYPHRMGKAQFTGKVNITANWQDGGIYVTSNGIDVNGAQQPVTAIFRSQKNTVVEFNRMYTQGNMLQFKQNNDNRGYFNNSGTTTTYYDQGSDERLKTNFEEWDEKVLPHFKALKPKKFNWIEDDAGAPKVKGFIAQENLDKFPEAYHLNEDDRYWFSKSEMVPYLMKALQEEIVKREEIEAKYNALEARIAALESS